MDGVDGSRPHVSAGEGRVPVSANSGSHGWTKISPNWGPMGSVATARLGSALAQLHVATHNSGSVSRIGV